MISSKAKQTPTMLNMAASQGSAAKQNKPPPCSVWLRRQDLQQSKTNHFHPSPRLL
jgi:hypothetical protein